MPVILFKVIGLEQTPLFSNIWEFMKKYGNTLHNGGPYQAVYRTGSSNDLSSYVKVSSTL